MKNDIKVNETKQELMYFRRLSHMRNLRKALFIVFGILTLFSCRKERFFNGTTKLHFSTDTIWFDTLFTREPGTKYPISVTRIFTVKNKENLPVKASFRLGGGKNSSYRFNVDGLAGPEIPEVEIGAKDSVFVFVQCSLDANNQTQPALVLDSLLTVVNGNEQKTILSAWGWDAHYFHSVQLPCGEVWADKTKPYVIIESALVPRGCTFTIKEGVTVYNSARSVLLVQGTLKIEGTATENVVFTGDKAAYDARFLPAQWGGIYLLPASVNNSIRFAKIHNANIAVRVDSLPASGNYNLEIENSSLMHCGQACMAGITAGIKATNCLFAESGTYSFLGLLGGKYHFTHCTFANYSNYTSRETGHFALTNTLRDGNGVISNSKALECNMVNSIVYGSQQESLFMDNQGSEPFLTDVSFCMIRSKDKPFTNNITYNTDPLFAEKTRDYSLDTLSPAIDKGKVLIPPVNTDISGKTRIGLPDLGAYERE